MIDNETFDKVAQNSHWAGGLALIYGSIALFGPDYLIHFTLFGVTYAAVKEFWWDYHYESTEVRGSSAEDFAYYCVGLAVALVSYAVSLYVRTGTFLP
jgi:hypothetical protein